MGEGNIELPKVDVINNLTDGGTDKALSAEQGKELKGMIPTKVSELENDEGYITSPTIKTVVAITQADYDALEVKDETTLYLITE